MTDPTPRTTPSLSDRVLAARVARRFYRLGQPKYQIALELGISRFKVARLLTLAREWGIVRITIVEPGSIDTDLSEQLCERFGLRRALVVETTPGDNAVIRDQLGRAAAQLLAEIMEPEDVLGLGWARVVLAMAAHVTSLRARRVVQLSGALTRPDVEPTAIELVRDVARSVPAPACIFHAPMIASDPEAARVMLRQEQVADAFAAFPSVTKAVVGVGGWQPPASTLLDALSAGEKEAMRDSNVRADLSGVLLDPEGHVVETPINDRLITISAAQLRAIPEVIGIAYGLEKVVAARAAIRGGYLDSLVTEKVFAQSLLAN